MATNRMSLVCTECGEALELAGYEPPWPGQEGLWDAHVDTGFFEGDDELGHFLNQHRHDASPLFGPTCFRLAFDVEQEG